MRIAVLHMGFFYNGGGERTVLSEALELERRGHSVDVYAPTRSRDCFPEMLGSVSFREWEGFLPRRIPLRNVLGMILASLTTGAVAKRLSGYDVVLAHSQPSHWLAYTAKRREGVPYVGYLHQANRFLYPRSIDRETRWGVNGDMAALDAVTRSLGFIKRLDQASVRASDSTLVNSQWIKRQVDDAYRVESEVCYPGVDEDEFQPSRDCGGYILSTNRHYPQKRLDLLIRAVGMLPGAEAVITGADTTYTGHLRRLADRLRVSGRVHFTGSVPAASLRELYRHAAVYSYPSPEEDFGLGPVEAAASGVPSVVWDNAGPREVVEHGVTGFRAPLLDLEAYAEAHARLLGDQGLRERMGAAARRRVEARFTWRRHVDQLEKRLEETQ